MAKPTKKSQSAQVEEIKAKADKAAAKSKTAPKADTVKAEKKATEAAKAQQAATAKAASGDKGDDKALFLHHLPKITAAKQKIKDATNEIRLLYKTAKADGFLKKDFDAAFEMQGEDGEKAKKAAIARELQIAQWLGYDLGAQLDLFAQDERVPAEERAYSEGEADSMQGKPLKPNYHPATPQYAAYVKGFNNHQDTLLKGFKQTDPEESYGTGVDGTPAKPSNVVAMTREEMKKQQAAGHQAH